MEAARRAFAWLEERGFELREVDSVFLEWHSDEANVLVALRPAPDGSYRGVQMALGPADEPDLERYLSMYVLEQMRPPPEDASFKPLGQALLRATDLDSMRASLDRIAELLRTQFAEPLASGSDGLRALKEESRQRIRDWVERSARTTRAGTPRRHSTRATTRARRCPTSRSPASVARLNANGWTSPGAARTSADVPKLIRRR